MTFNFKPWGIQDIDNIPKDEFIDTCSMQLQEYIKGWPKNDISFIMASSGQGKSYVIEHLAVLAAREHKVLFISLENSKGTDRDRFEEIGKQYNVNDNLMILNNDDIDWFYKDENGKVIDCSGEKYIYLVKLITEFKPDILFIDGTEFLVSIGDVKEDNLFSSYGQIALKLREVAKISEIPVVCTWQLNRSAASISIANYTEEQVSRSVIPYEQAYYVITYQHIYTDLDGHTDTIPRFKFIKARGGSVNDNLFMPMKLDITEKGKLDLE